MSDAAVQHGLAGEYEAPFFGAYSKKVGMWLFLASDSLTFGALLFAFSYNRIYTAWPTPFHVASIVNATIKSGTNAFHGDIWEFFRNDKLNANSWSNNLVYPALPKAKIRWNMFGGTFGGPIIKNKLFFFADYQA